ncbi:hypothetical protein AWB68_07617 [Caballeronia choica]|uniref:Uncharacterized protein n=2 Tax=Caballeronia choica TaxID=326476 RepID=A0A158KX03_9BURK|nr:hypothetical protein AWB68_07617 [Caballeronia choica]
MGPAEYDQAEIYLRFGKNPFSEKQVFALNELNVKIAEFLLWFQNGKPAQEQAQPETPTALIADLRTEDASGVVRATSIANVVETFSRPLASAKYPVRDDPSKKTSPSETDKSVVRTFSKA